MGANFNPSLDAWVLTSYNDVLAGLREPQLSPANPLPEKLPKAPDLAKQQRMRTDVQAALPAVKLTDWSARLDTLAVQLLRQHPLELVQQFTQPVCLAAAELVCESDLTDSDHVLTLARTISASAAEPFDRELQTQASQANKALAKALNRASIPMPGPTFVALSRTLACILDNGWLALLNQPDRLAKLRAQPSLMPRAVEEILRLAGVPQTIFRRATASVELNGLAIAAGERVILKIAAANRDPGHFTDPDRLDWRRKEANHLSLGHGTHSCVGGALLRMAIAAATRAFVNRFENANISGETEWIGGSGFRSPAAIHVS